MNKQPSPAAISHASRHNRSRLLWSIALPAMLTNLATALFGLADMWAIGRLGDAQAQGAVELGAKFMIGLLNVFNFLRTSTVALTAQSGGRGDISARAETLSRAIAVALGIGMVLIAIKPFAIFLGLDLLDARDPLRTEADHYISIRYWAAPLWLSNCVLVGWLVGQRKVRQVLLVEVCANIVHIALDLLLVLVVDWGVEGVAFATLLSEALKLLLLAAIASRYPAAHEAFEAFVRKSTWQRRELARLFALNRDLFARTLLLTGAMMLFARIGARSGPETLAANGILFQLFMLATLLLDGFENAAQVLCGEAAGAGDRRRLSATLRLALSWGGLLGTGLALTYFFAARDLTAWFSTAPQVRALTATYAPWVALLPLAGFASFVLDGVFVGAAWTRAMLGTMLFAIGCYAMLLWLAQPLGNHGLWLAFTVFFIARAAGQLAILPRLLRRIAAREA
ncbi:MATE family efflux transporter [Novosphingobium aureum]|nr:MATE family efflux transporter [Novosphingobium aureum]